jgi:hypothetical protein
LFTDFIIFLFINKKLNQFHIIIKNLKYFKLLMKILIVVLFFITLLLFYSAFYKTEGFYCNSVIPLYDIAYNKLNGPLLFNKYGEGSCNCAYEDHPYQSVIGLNSQAYPSQEIPNFKEENDSVRTDFIDTTKRYANYGCDFTCPKCNKKCKQHHNKEHEVHHNKGCGEHHKENFTRGCGQTACGSCNLDTIGGFITNGCNGSSLTTAPSRKIYLQEPMGRLGTDTMSGYPYTPAY